MSTTRKAASCGICKGTIESLPLICLRCRGTFHDTCVKHNENILAWTCSSCKGYLNPPSVPKTQRARSVISHLSSQHSSELSRNMSRHSKGSNMSKKAEEQLAILEEEEQLLQKQSEERSQMIEEQIRQIKEREKYQQQLIDEMEDKHRRQKELLARKSILLETIHGSAAGSDAGSEASSANGSKREVLSSREKVEHWNITFDLNNQARENIESTNIHHPVDNSPVIAESHQPVTAPPITRQPSINKPKPPAHRESAVPTHTQPYQSPSDGNNLYRYWNSSYFGSKSFHDLPKFDGKASDWPKFYSKYLNTAATFTADVNLDRLQNSLQGAAKAAVGDLLTMPDNVPVIIETLRNFFGKPEYIINDLLENVRRSSKPKMDDFDSIISFSLQVKNICSTMVAARLSDHLWNPLLLQELTEKLPIQYKVEWAEMKSSVAQVNLEVFSSWLYSKSLKLTSILNKPPTFTNKTNVKINVHQEVEEARKYVCVVCSGDCKSLCDCEEFISKSSEERWKVVKKFNHCRCCLRQHSGKCRFSKICGKEGCNSRHNSLLHPFNTSSTIPENPINTHASENIKVLFKIIPVTLHRKKKTVDTYALLDDGSSATLIAADLAEQLDVEDAIPDPLCLKWTTNQVNQQIESVRFDTQISAREGTKKHQLINVRTVDALYLPTQSLNDAKLKRDYPYLKDIPFTSYKNVTPKLLIGINNSLVMMSMKSKSGGRNEPIASKTPLGWVVYGGEEQRIPSVFHICECKSSMESELSSIVKKFIATDNLSTSPLQKEPQSEQDKRAMQLLENNVKFNGLRFECSLLWSHDNIQLPKSYDMAFQRLLCLEKKFLKFPSLKNTIESQISSYLEKKYIRKLSEHEIQAVGDKCWYLPIFAVTNPNKPQKVRIVWDGAAKSHGVSLNSVLLKGPDFLVSLLGVLMRFREKKVGVGGDIREMFHQINVKESDQHFQRFLYRFDPTEKPIIFAMTVMTFGASCSPTIAQYVKNQNAGRFESSFPKAAMAIKQNHYVDDWLESVDCENEAIELARQVKCIHQSGGFTMGSWISNLPSVVNALGSEESIKKNMDLSSESTSEKVLGMWWDVKEDVFTYTLRFNKGDDDVLQGKRIPSKRQLLRIIMSVYDPLGFLAHFMAYAKILLQCVWRKGIKWDDDVPEDLLPFWYEWLYRLPEIEKIKIPRFYFNEQPFEDENLELHIFVDGSEEGYAAVGYLKSSSRGKIQCRLIAAKSRVAPLKHHSIPRLELLAAVLGVRLAVTIQKEHSIKFSKRYFWSDSKTVCCWIKSEHRRYKQFVACRVGEILEFTEENEWMWLRGSNNVADLATRMSLVDLSNESNWFRGPSFLYTSEYDADCCEVFPPTEEELRPHILHNIVFHHMEASLERFSNWSRLKRTYAYICRFKNNLKAASKDHRSIGSLSQAEIQEGEIVIIRQAQVEKFTDEIAELKNSSTAVMDKRSELYKLTPFLDCKGLLRRKGRLDDADFLDYDAKNPIILPHQHRVTFLIVKWYHNKYHHNNHETVVNEFRQRFHYTHIRKELRRIMDKHCQKCRNDRAKPRPPIMASLPKCRLQPFTRPFTFIGVDYFGPVLVGKSKHKEKRWGVLVTCLTFRAIHLEIVETLTTSSCILAMRNFMNRRGQPREIYSDNATTFKGACRELKEAISNLEKSKLEDEFNNVTTNWYFIPPTAAHM